MRTEPGGSAGSASAQRTMFQTVFGNLRTQVTTSFLLLLVRHLLLLAWHLLLPASCYILVDFSKRVGSCLANEYMNEGILPTKHPSGCPHSPQGWNFEGFEDIFSIKQILKDACP